MSFSGGDIVIAAAVLVGVVQLFTESDPIGRSWMLVKQLLGHESHLLSSKNVDTGIDSYNDLHHNQTEEKRNKSYKSLVDMYYDLSTVFYEWGWGPCFHFANRCNFESFSESLRRHEYQLVSKLELNKQKQKILDVGCGIGGPLRNVSKFLLADHDLTGLTLNQYQVIRGNAMCRADPLVDELKCRLQQGDFMNMPFKDDCFDAAFAIEATCHAPDRVKCYSEIKRVLKPGAVFACYEWCLTDKFVKDNPEHERIKKLVEEGNGLPSLTTTTVCIQALKDAGFEVLETRDMALDRCDIPWFRPLLPLWNPLTQRFQFTWLGFRITNAMVQLLEFLYLAPKGTFKTQKMLQQAGWGCGQGGKLGVFTPMLLMVGRVPQNKK